MKRISEFKVSLLKKDKNFSIDKENKGNYISRSKAIFKPIDYIKQQGLELSNDDYPVLVVSLIGAVYNDLIHESLGIEYETIGLRIKFNDGEILENALDTMVLDAFQEYGSDVVPIEEFAKMTLQLDESKIN